MKIQHALATLAGIVTCTLVSPALAQPAPAPAPAPGAESTDSAVPTPAAPLVVTAPLPVPAPPPVTTPVVVPPPQPDETAPSAKVIEPGPPASPAGPPAVVDDSWTKHVDLHGGLYAWLYQPIAVPAVQNNFDLYFVHLLLDAKVGELGLHFEPRFRDSKLVGRPFFESNIWIQEGYAFWKRDPVAVKLGKIYSRFGKFWDNSFYGNLSYFDGFKLAPEHGVSVEGSTTTSKVGPKLDFAAQYFVIDGLTNGSFRGGDTLFDIGSRRRNIAIARVEPVYQINETTSVSVGASGQYFQADLVDAGTKDVYRVAAEATAKLGGLTIFAEYTYQHGQHVKDYPVKPIAATATTAAIPGATSSNNHYLWTGAELKIDKFVARYNFSFVRYADVDIDESMHQPGIGYAFFKNLSVLTEFALWRTHFGDAKGTAVFDRSLNLIAYASF